MIVSKDTDTRKPTATSRAGRKRRQLQSEDETESDEDNKPLSSKRVTAKLLTVSVLLEGHPPAKTPESGPIMALGAVLANGANGKNRQPN